MTRHTHLFAIILLAAATFLGACSDKNDQCEVDQLNELSYSCHYRSLENTTRFAQKALQKADSYDAGTAEAYNNLAFVSIAKMDYPNARKYLDYAIAVTDNLVEQLVANVQIMRLCQRQSQNKEFYSYMQTARLLMRRINEEQAGLNKHQQQRLEYAQSEYAIVASTYFYYVGFEDAGAEMLNMIDPNGNLVKDTAQILNYYYNIGAGGIIQSANKDDICITEFDYLVRCYLLARQYNYPFWEANSLQSMSEHLQDAHTFRVIRKNNPQEIEFINQDRMCDSLLAGNLAARSLEIFKHYGDVYQTAGSYRTLAQCYWALNDFPSALICLNNSLKNKRVNYAPDLVASIREKLSLVYSAMDDKPRSDYNRNLYLDLQEVTRQDRMLEARADELNQSARQLNTMIAIVCIAIIALIVFLFWLNHLRRNNKKEPTEQSLMDDLKQLKTKFEAERSDYEDEVEELQEKIDIANERLRNYNIINLEQRAKISITGSIMSLINRITNEIDKLRSNGQESEQAKEERFKYVFELSKKINEYNTALTQWITLRKGDLNLHIESFELQPLFDILAKGRTQYEAKGITLDIIPTSDMVKADKALTLFMINTIADNARKFTQEGGKVTVCSSSTDKYVEISITDDGKGMDANEVAKLFSRNIINDNNDNSAPRQLATEQVSHGFGLMNCKGIIEKYKKTSSKFDVCMIDAESKPGQGTRFFFRLPKGIVRTLMLIVAFTTSFTFADATANDSRYYLAKSGEFADSAYFCNVQGHYSQTLTYADSCIYYLNRYCTSVYPNVKYLMKSQDDDFKSAAELQWFQAKMKCNYNIILDIRNESAVASLALHNWKAYEYNNKVYTQLFRECSADNTLADYVNVMKKSEVNKNVAIILLIILFLSLFPAYYFLYYRYRLQYRYIVDRIKQIDEVILSSATSDAKLAAINKIWDLDNRTQHSTRMQTLVKIVDSIKNNLQKDIAEKGEQAQNLTLLNEDLQRVEYQKDKIYVSNNVLDNCLSTIKHETMYYPSRIMQLVDNEDRNLQSISELAYYYHDLFTMLSEQATMQANIGLRMDYGLVMYIFELLKKIANGEEFEYKVDPVAKTEYVKICGILKNVNIEDEQITELFSPNTIDFRFLLCRQIIREYAELTNSHGCGIQAYRDENEHLKIEITLTKKIWTNSKLS